MDKYSKKIIHIHIFKIDNKLFLLIDFSSGTECKLIKCCMNNQ